MARGGDVEAACGPGEQRVDAGLPVGELDGGIDRADIAKLEIKLQQGTRYEIWLDNIAFYRRR